MFENYTHDDLEQALLSRLLFKPDELWECENLNEDVFNVEIHRRIYNAICNQLRMGYPVNAPALARVVGDDAKEYLMELAGDYNSWKAKDLSAYLAKEKSVYKALNETSDLIDRAEQDKSVDFFTEINRIASEQLDTASEVSNDKIKEELEKRMRGEMIGIDTGIAMLDDYINSLQKGRLYIVGARPSMGKTAFMCSIVEKIEHKHKVGILSLEMTTAEIKQRLACLRQNIKHWVIEKGKCNQNEATKYFEGLDSFTKLRINDKGGLDRYQISAIIRQMVAREKCEVIFIDHLGLIKTDNKGNLAHEIGENTTMLKCLAKEYNIPIVCLCQINRGVEQGLSKKPRLSDLRDSGRIEEDADCVILLYRENYYNPQSDNEAEYHIAKCRNGRTGVVNGYFEGDYMKWS